MASGKCGDDLNDILTSQLECPVCFVICTSPIYLCINGHNVCGDCQKTLKACPVCRKDGRPSIRNLFAEQVSLSITTNCQNQGQGCNASFKVKEMTAHLQTCEFGYKCMFLDCNWRGSVVNLGQHVKMIHPSCYLDVNEKGTLVCIDGDEYEEEEDMFLTTMLVYNERIYWFQIDITDLSSLDAVVRLIGPEDNKIASKVSYMLEFCSADGRKRVACTNNVRSLNDDRNLPADSVFDDTFALSSMFDAYYLVFTVSMFTDRVVGKLAVDGGGRMEVLFRCPQSWPDVDYREKKVRREGQKRESDW